MHTHYLIVEKDGNCPRVYFFKSNLKMTQIIWNTDTEPLFKKLLGEYYDDECVVTLQSILDEIPEVKYTDYIPNEKSKMIE